MTAAMLGSCMDQECEESLSMSSEEELIFSAASGDTGAKLKLVKAYMDLVVEVASQYASAIGLPFPQMVQAGVLSVIKAADRSHFSRQSEFVDLVREEFTSAVEERYMQTKISEMDLNC